MSEKLQRALYALIGASAVYALARFVPLPWNGPAAALLALAALWLGRARVRKAAVDGNYISLLGEIGDGNLTVSPEELAAGNPRAATAAAQMIFGLRRMVASIRGLGHGLDSATARLETSAAAMLSDARAQSKSVSAASESLNDLESSAAMVQTGVTELTRAGDRNAAAVIEMQSSIEEVSAGIGELVDTVAKTNELSKVATTSAAQVARSAELLTASATQNAAAMLEMDATIQQVNRLAQESEQVAARAVGGVESGRAAVEATVGALRAIESATGQSAEAVRALGERGAQIGSIVSVIKEIADQTGLLALNASILAAQAGEHGRGFSVVAEEIRELSERTAGSTREISELIYSIRDAVETARGTMEVGAARARDGVAIGVGALDSFGEIGGLIDRARLAAGSIAHAMDEQSKGSHEVTQAIENMSQQITQISEEAQQQAQVARELTAEADQMHERGMQFKQAMTAQSEGTAAISRVTEQLSTSIESIRSALQAIAASVSDLSRVTHQLEGSATAGTNSAQQLSLTVTGLNHEARFLRDELSRFRLPEPEPTAELRIAIRDTSGTLDFTAADNVRSHELSGLIGEGLLAFGNGSALEPRLAESWLVTEDGLEYRFKLKPGLRFSDGSPLRAEDFIASFERVVDPRTGNSLSWVFEPIVGFEEFRDGKSPSMSGVRAEDASTLSFRLKRPLVFFPSLTTLPPMCVMPTEYARAHHDDRPCQPTGTGPFRVVSANESSVELARNTHYHRAGVPHADKLHIRLDLDGEHQLTAFRAGELAYLSDVPRSSRPELLHDPELKPLIETMTLMATTFIGFRCDIPPFNDKRVRLAVNYALNRDKLVREIHGGVVKAATGFLPPGLLGYDSARPGFRFDPAHARQLMAEAGHAGGLEIPLFGTAGQSWDTDPERRVVREMLEAIGLRVRYEVVTDNESRRRIRESGRTLLHWSGWFADYPDPDNFHYVVLHSSQSKHIGTHYSNARFDELVVKAQREADLGTRARLYQEAETVLAEDPPFAVMYHDQGMVIHQPDLGGVFPHFTTPMVRAEEVWRMKKRG